MKSFRNFVWTLAVVGLFMGCAATPSVSVEEKYEQAVELMDKGQYSQVTPVLLEVIDQNPGTRYSTYAHLKLGDAWMAIGENEENYNAAEIQYRIFLKHSPGSHLVPYVMSRLIELNYRRNISLLFNETYAYARDPGHFRSIVEEYKRFFLLYPDSFYLEEAREYLALAERALAKHEVLIGDWYFKHRHYHSAIARYQYTLKTYTNFEERKEVLEKLIRAYQKNQQPNRAAEMEQVYLTRFGG
ncbi:MAG: outer membrane protein assembly factor BamD [bacterium]|nr:outer membrane protein assembly factor BamD [bacterium]